MSESQVNILFGCNGAEVFSETVIRFFVLIRNSPLDALGLSLEDLLVGLLVILRTNLVNVQSSITYRVEFGQLCSCLSACQLRPGCPPIGRFFRF